VDIDLVQYVVVVVPDLDSLASVAPAFAGLVEVEAIRILDLVVAARNTDGTVRVLELEDVASLGGLTEVEGEVGGLLSDHDIELVALTLRPGEAGMIVVTEDRWAEALALSARRAGGVIMAGERIPRSRVQAALNDLSGPEGSGGADEDA
jgi:Family of unknown function (DUF6325)